MPLNLLIILIDTNDKAPVKYNVQRKNTLPVFSMNIRTGEKTDGIYQWFICFIIPIGNTSAHTMSQSSRMDIKEFIANLPNLKIDDHFKTNKANKKFWCLYMERKNGTKEIPSFRGKVYSKFGPSEFLFKDKEGDNISYNVSFPLNKNPELKELAEKLDARMIELVKEKRSAFGFRETDNDDRFWDNYTHGAVRISQSEETASKYGSFMKARMFGNTTKICKKSRTKEGAYVATSLQDSLDFGEGQYDCVFSFPRVYRGEKRSFGMIVDMTGIAFLEGVEKPSPFGDVPILQAEEGESDTQTERNPPSQSGEGGEEEEESQPPPAKKARVSKPDDQPFS